MFTEYLGQYCTRKIEAEILSETLINFWPVSAYSG
jgi:hypothetical protein